MSNVTWNTTVSTRTKVKFGKLCEKHPEFKGERFLDHACVECKRLKNIAKRTKNKDKVREYNLMYKSENKEKVLAKNREYMHSYKNTDTFKLSRKLGKVVRERGISCQVISKYFKDQVSEVYRNCPDGHHVDHIIPLKGKGVSGLHVPWNMQYLAAKENIKKGIAYDQ